MSEFTANLRSRVLQARQAARSAAEAGDEDRASLHEADLENLERLAHDHGIDVGSTMNSGC